MKAEASRSLKNTLWNPTSCWLNQVTKSSSGSKGLRDRPQLPSGSFSKESTCSTGDHLQGRILGFDPWVQIPGEGNDNPLQYSCWETPWTEEPGELQSMGSQEPDTT